MSGLQLDADTRRKALAAARLLVSDTPGEALAGARAIERLTGISIADLVRRGLTGGIRTAVHCHAIKAAACLRRGKLSAWEQGFLRDVSGRRQISQRQAEIVEALYSKVSAND